MRAHRLCNEQRPAQPHRALLWVPGAGYNLCNCTWQPCDRRGDQLRMQWTGGRFYSGWFCQTSPCHAQSRGTRRKKCQSTPSRDCKRVQREMCLFLMPLTAPECFSHSVYLSSLSVRTCLCVSPPPPQILFKFAATTKEDFTESLRSERRPEPCLRLARDPVALATSLVLPA